jgi:hypothetical protein
MRMINRRCVLKSFLALPLMSLLLPEPKRPVNPTVRINENWGRIHSVNFYGVSHWDAKLGKSWCNGKLICCYMGHSFRDEYESTWDYESLKSNMERLCRHANTSYRTTAVAAIDGGIKQEIEWERVALRC